MIELVVQIVRVRVCWEQIAPCTCAQMRVRRANVVPGDHGFQGITTRDLIEKLKYSEVSVLGLGTRLGLAQMHVVWPYVGPVATRAGIRATPRWARTPRRLSKVQITQSVCVYVCN